MIIKEKPVYVFDIEVFPNVFHCSVKNTETKQLQHFELSIRKNEIAQMCSLFKSKDIMFCGYNCIHYDNPIINFILEYEEKIVNYAFYNESCKAIHTLSDWIIQGDIEKWKKWKYATQFYTLDLLTMLFSEKLRVGLKEMEVTMQFHNVQEYEGDFNQRLPESEIDKMIAYNDNDVEATEELLYRCEKQIQLRLGIEQEYGIDVLSLDGVSIGKEILKTKYLKDTGKNWYQIKDLRSPCDMVNLNDVILDKITYETKILQDLLKEMKLLTVSPGIDGWNKKFLFFDTVISIGVGGLHSQNEPEIIIPKEDECLMDWDAASLYPSLLISYGFYPQHLGKEFLTTYSNIKKERIEAKHNGNKIKNETLKLSLNSVTGLMQNEFSWMYSPKDVMKIRINGQLLLLKLAEMLILNTNCRVIQYNTDGIFCLIKKDKLNKANEVIKQFEEFSLLNMEGEEFEAFYQFAINDYLAIQKGYKESKNSKLLKKKGLFIDEVTLGKGMQPMIIPKAINKYFADNIPIEKTVKESKDINDFITYQKVGKQFSVQYDNKKVSRINRFYCSNNGYYIYKCKEEGIKLINPQHMLKSSGVIICNNLDEIKEFPKDINYRYYISEINKILYPLENTQMMLF